jgi:hypothetical protein
MSQNCDQNLIPRGAGGHVKIGAAPQRERGPDLIPVPIVPDRSGPTFPTFNMALVWPTGFGSIIIVTCVADVTTFHNVASSATPKYLGRIRSAGNWRDTNCQALPLLLLVAMRRRKLDVHGGESVVTNHVPEIRRLIRNLIPRPRRTAVNS